ncbi:MAG TPA: choice-of-anchor D domain-containing protein [Candidatus Binataceae bacterium]|nr:choice-of-anchor D domain-containing protein [Candidatus Binataceae bacterium]
MTKVLTGPFYPATALAVVLTVVMTLPHILDAQSIRQVSPHRRARVNSHGTRIPAQSSVPPRPSHPISKAPGATSGTWGLLLNEPPFKVGGVYLLTDGRVLAQDADLTNVAWWTLTPDFTGSYILGSWKQVASPPNCPNGYPGASANTIYSPLYYASAVLPDGRFIMVGGEYDYNYDYVNNDGKDEVWTDQGAIYDPVADNWTCIAPPTGWNQIGDAQSVVLPDGTLMVAHYSDNQVATLNASTNPPTFNAPFTPAGKTADYQNDEEGWTLLPDGTVLTQEIFNSNDPTETPALTYNPFTQEWSSAGIAPDPLVLISLGGTTYDEIGPSVLRPDGTVFVTGATGIYDIYDSIGDSWSSGSLFGQVSGQQLLAVDAPATLLPSGNVLVDVSPVYSPPSEFFEFDGSGLTIVDRPDNADLDASFQGRLLTLPNGQVLFTDGSNKVEIYMPTGSPDPSWAPTITNAPAVVVAGDGNYTITGTQFNGLSQAVGYGDDYGAATNYPLVQITNNRTGNVFFARSHNHSTMGVATGFTPVSTEFDVSWVTDIGPSMLRVIANGIASDPVPVNVTAKSTDKMADRVLGQLDFVSNLAGSGPTGMSQPFSVAVDSVGHLYVSDFLNNRVLGYLSAASFTNGEAADLVLGQPDFSSTACDDGTLAGDLGGVGPDSLCGSWAVAVDGSNNLYVTDSFTARVLEYIAPFAGCASFPCVGPPASRVLGQGGSFTGSLCNFGGTSADSLCFPEGVAVDNGGRLYIADEGNNRVLEYDNPLSSQTANRVFGQGGDFSTRLCNFDTGGGNPTTDDLCGAEGVTVDGNGHLYIADGDVNNRVLEFDNPLASTTADRVFGQNGDFNTRACGAVSSAGSLCDPVGLEVDSGGHLYVADVGDSRVLEFDTPLTDQNASRVYGQGGDFSSRVCSNGVQGPAPSAGGLCEPTGVAVDNSGNLYVADTLNNRVLAYDQALATPTLSPTATPSPTATISPTLTSSPTPTQTATRTATTTPTATVTITATPTPTAVPVTLKISPVAPKTLKFPKTTVGTASKPKPVTVSNPKGSKKNPGVAVLIERIVAAPGWFTQINNCPVAPTTLAPGGSCTISVTYRPSAPTTQAGTLTITDNANGSPQTVPLSGTGK